MLPTQLIQVGFDAGAADSDLLVFDDLERGLFDTGKFAGDTPWVTVTSDVRRVECRRGSTRYDGVYARAEAGTFSALLDNNSRDYDPTNAASPYAGQVVPMRPVRWQVPYDVPSGLHVPIGGYAETPDSAALSITGDMDLRIRITNPDQELRTRLLMSKWSDLQTAGSWLFFFVPESTSPPQDSYISFDWSTDGTNATEETAVFPGVPVASRLWLRVTTDATSVRGFYSLDDTNDHTEVVWQELTANPLFDPPTSTIYDGTFPVRVGAKDLDGFPVAIEGAVLAAAILDGVDGTEVANPCFHWDGPTSTQLTADTWQDSVGNVWTVNSPAFVQDPTTFDVWRGFADDWNLDYPHFGADAIVQVPATDGIKLLQFDGAEQSPVGASEDTGTRIGRLLDNANWPTTDRRIDEGASTVQATTLAENTWTEISKTVDSEVGEIYLTGDGKVRFRNRHAQITDARSRVSRAVFGDADGELGFASLRPTSAGLTIKNYISAARAGGSAQLAEDVQSQNDYQIRSLVRTDLLLETDAATSEWAEYVLYLLKDPDISIESLTIKPQSDPANLWPQVLGREIGDRITIRLTPNGGGARIDRDVFIRGIAHSVTPQEWVTTWTCQDATKLSDVMIFDVGLLDTAVFGF